MNRLSFAILTNKLFNEWIKNNRSFVDVQVSLEETEYDEFMSIIYESKNIYAFLTYSKYYNISELTEEFLNSLKEAKPKEYLCVKIYMESIENSIKEIVNMEYIEESNIPRKSILDYEMFMNYYHANMRKYFSTKEDKEKRLLKETLDIFNGSL